MGHFVNPRLCTFCKFFLHTHRQLAEREEIFAEFDKKFRLELLTLLLFWFIDKAAEYEY